MRYSREIKNWLFRHRIISPGKFGFCKREVAILRYHSISEPNENFYASPSICVTPEQFENQVRYFSENYNITSLDAVAERFAKRLSLPERSVIFTFDDGYRDNYDAYKIMRKYGVVGTFYLTAGCIGGGEVLWLFELMYQLRNTDKSEVELVINGKNQRFSLASANETESAIRLITQIVKSNNLEVRENIREQLRSQLKEVSELHDIGCNIMLTWDQVREMADNGMTIGGHTMTHLNLAHAKYTDAVRELNECKKTIEKEVGVSIRHFSYPNGGSNRYYNKWIMKAVKEAGYYSATTSKNGLVHINSNVYELNRIRITESLPEIAYQIQCEPVLKKLLGI